jgi:ATP-binding cassette subfamily C protein
MISSPGSQSVANAAQKACAHEMILHPPESYDTMLGGGGMQLSGGQMRRIGLAHALYRDPVNLILDKPNSNLDSAGNTTLNTTIRQIKAIQKTGLIIGRWPAAIVECGILPVLDDGRQTVFGPHDKIRASMVQNHGNIASAIGTNSAGLR